MFPNYVAITNSICSPCTVAELNHDLLQMLLMDFLILHASCVEL